ncbi:MAG: class I SAM-dependent methyltransferase [Chloroflexi bacterium]|nr:class I SAM-dependent methyltransferase [Chloroflexota bacterium]
MQNFSNPGYLRRKQYKTDENLNARISLHERFSTNKGSWHGWVFSHLELTKGSRVLELGCGPGNLWVENQPNNLNTLTVLLSDISPGMASTARENLSSLPTFKFICSDAQNAPFSREGFDLVIANHMLYHLPNIDLALREIDRILTPKGALCATTNGNDHLNEIWSWVREALPERRDAQRALDGMYGFSLANGQSLLAQCFSQIFTIRTTRSILLKYSRSWISSNHQVCWPNSITEN